MLNDVKELKYTHVLFDEINPNFGPFEEDQQWKERKEKIKKTSK